METSSETPPFYLGPYNCEELIGQGRLGEKGRARNDGVAGFKKQFAVERLLATWWSDETVVSHFVLAGNEYAAAHVT